MANESNILEAALLRTMTLLASLNVATEITFAMRERKAGRDPAAEEQNDVALPRLQDELKTLRGLVFQLTSSLALMQETDMGVEVDSETAPVQRFIDLVRLQKASGALRVIHQRLLSLYPAIDESLAEEARMLKNTCEHLQEVSPEKFAEALASFVDSARQFTSRLGSTFP